MTSLVNRRWVLKTFAASGGGLAIGCSASSELSTDMPGSSTSELTLTSMVRIYPDNRAVIVTPRAEMGQSIFTGLAKIIADEMDLDWPNINVENAPHHPDFYDLHGNQSAGGSNAMRNFYAPLRQLGAAGRDLMVRAAAKHWQTSADLCNTESGFVIHSQSGQKLAYGDLIPEAKRIELTTSPVLKTDEQLTLIGRPVKRKDSRAKIDGTAIFGADIRLPDQVYAAVHMAPKLGGQVKRFDRNTVMSMPGIIDVIDLGNALAVVANHWWQANSALSSMNIEFSDGLHPTLNDIAIDKELNHCLNSKKGVDAILEGDPDQRLNKSEQVYEARYSLPYLAHACMETMTATVSVEESRVLAYAPTQSPQRFAKRVAVLTGHALDKVEMNNTFIGGGFGRKGTDLQALEQATRLSLKLKRPVQVIWSRENDIQHDQHRPASKYWFRASLSSGGNIDAVNLRVAAPSIGRQRFPDFYKPDRSELPPLLFAYDSSTRRHTWIEADLPVTIGYWRAVGHSSHPFATESFVDELAYKNNEDPFEFRFRNLQDHSRLQAVLKTAAKFAQWGRPVSGNHGLGIAVQEGWDSVCAQVAEVSVTDGQLSIHDIWVAADCGKIIDPDSVSAQIESSITYALTAALKGEISIQAGAVVESNFHNYNMLKIAEMPRIHVTLMESNLPPGGVGELGVPPCAPAITNALFAATGYRARSLPLKHHQPFSVSS